MRQDSASQLFEANAMREADVQQGGLFSYVSVESRIPANHPLRAVRTLLDEALASMSRDFDRVYADGGRSSVPPERLIKAKVARKLLRRMVRQARRSGGVGGGEEHAPARW